MFAEARKLGESLSQVPEVAKIAFSDVNEDMAWLRGGIKELETEVTWHGALDEPMEGDNFQVGRRCGAAIGSRTAGHC